MGLTADEEWPPRPLRRVRLQADDRGDVVLPAELLKDLGILPYDVLLAWRDDDELRLERLDAALRRAHDYFYSRITTGRLSEEIGADRRVEALRELWE